MTITSPVPAYPEPRGLLKGKTVVVTAAAGTGIGFAVAKRAAEEGAALLISDFHERRLGEAADRIAAETGTPRPATFVCDVTSEEQVQGLRDTALSTLGGVDVLINNAGLGGEVDVVDMTDDQWSRVLDVTLTSLFRMTRAFLPAMYAAKSGVMVNNASVLGWRAQKGQAHYAAAKAGVMAFTRCAALEAAEHGVRINAVAPTAARCPGSSVMKLGVKAWISAPAKPLLSSRPISRSSSSVSTAPPGHHHLTHGRSVCGGAAKRASSDCAASGFVSSSAASSAAVRIKGGFPSRSAARRPPPPRRSQTAPAPPSPTPQAPPTCH